jgi:peptidoglycan/xylan/chitin deacetylase (PgdA/CDA1 family)
VTAKFSRRNLLHGVAAFLVWNVSTKTETDTMMRKTLRRIDKYGLEKGKKWRREEEEEEERRRGKH